MESILGLISVPSHPPAVMLRVLLRRSWDLSVAVVVVLLVLSGGVCGVRCKIGLSLSVIFVLRMLAHPHRGE